MNDVTIYHNPRCSKSRQTLQMIKDHGIQPVVVEYLKVPLKKSELDNISRLLNKRPKNFVRKNEADFKENNIKNIIFIGTDLPDLCHQDLLNTLKELQQNDLILGPSNDGGYWLIGLSEKMMSSHIYLPFINIKWGTENVLQNTIDNFATTKLRYKFLDKKIDIDTIIDIENRK